MILELFGGNVLKINALIHRQSPRGASLCEPKVRFTKGKSKLT